MPRQEGSTASLEELNSQADAILGPEDKNKDKGGAHKSPSFKSQFEELKKASPEAVKDIASLAERISKGRRRLEKEVKENDKTPAHNEIMNIQENSVQQDRLDLDYLLIERAFVANGRVAPAAGIEFPVLKLDHLEEHSPNFCEHESDNPTATWNVIRSQKEKPYIFYTQVRTPVREVRDFWQDKGKTKETGEVLVTISMNNGDTPETNTVVTMLVKHEGGRLLWGNGQSGLYRTQSEKEYRDAQEKGERSVANDLMVQGRVTVAQYNARFYKEEHKTFEKYQEEKDRKLTEAPPVSNIHAGEIMERREKTAEERRELLKRLNGEYVTRLQQLQELEAAILKRAEASIEAIEARNAQILQSDEFKALVNLLLVTSKDNLISDAVKHMEQSLVKKFGVSTGYLEKLLGGGK